MARVLTAREPSQPVTPLQSALPIEKEPIAKGAQNQFFAHTLISLWPEKGILPRSLKNLNLLQQCYSKELSTTRYTIKQAHAKSPRQLSAWVLLRGYKLSVIGETLARVVRARRSSF